MGERYISALFCSAGASSAAACFAGLDVIAPNSAASQFLRSPIVAGEVFRVETHSIQNELSGDENLATYSITGK